MKEIETNDEIDVRYYRASQDEIAVGIRRPARKVKAVVRRVTTAIKEN
jgi:hypothetical protein